MEVPETLEGVPGKESGPKVKCINLRGHCAFCLRKLKDGKAPVATRDHLNEVSQADLPQNVVSTVNWVWDALKVGQEGDGDIFGPRSESKGGTKFGGLPKLCVDCGNKVLGVDMLLREVRRMIGELRRLLTRCNEQGSCGQFVRTLHKSGLDAGVVADTMEFLEEFRSRIDGTQKEDESMQGDLGEDVEDEKELVSCEASLSSMAKDPLAIDDNDVGDPDFEASGDDDSSYKNENSSEEEDDDEDDDYIPRKRAKFAKSSTQKKLSANRPSETFVGDYIKEEGEDGNNNDTAMEPDPLATSQLTKNEVPITVTTRNSTMSVYPSVPSTIKAKEETEHGDDVPKSDMLSQTDNQSLEPPHLKIIIPPGASSSIKRDDAGKSLYLIVRRRGRYGSTVEYYVCLLHNCGYHFEGKNALELLQSHQNKHPEEYNGKPVQPWSFTTKEVIKGTHKLTQTTFRCEICAKTERSANQMMIHLKEKHKVDPGVIKAHHESEFVQTCELCKVRLPRKELREHVKGHVGEEYTIQCPNPECWFVCVSSPKLYYHLQFKNNAKCRQKAGIGKDVEEFKTKQRNCKICGFIGKNLLALRCHLLEEHETPEKNFPCPVSGCEAKFTLRESVVLHLGQHDFSQQVDVQSCLECEDKKQIKLEEMVAHLKEEHNVQEVVKCIQCPFRFSSREELLNHMFEHRFGELLCDICGRAGGKFSRHARLVEHYFTQHQIGKQYQCEYCARCFWSLNSLSGHVEHQHGDNSRSKSQVSKQSKPTFTCEDCALVLKTRSAFISHRIKVHGDPPLACKFCSQTFSGLIALQEHEKVVHKGISKPNEFPCDEPNCGKVFKTKQQLKFHNKYTHLGEKGSYVCEHCSKPFKNSTGLKTHVDTVHLGLRSYCCEVCGETFTSSTVLRKHGLIHTGERPFACDICDQRFRHKEVLQRHLISHQEKGADFKPNGPMKKPRARVHLKRKAEAQ